MEFKSFSEITRLSSQVTITEKVHGTNAQILIQDNVMIPTDDPMVFNVETTIKAGSRTRWLELGDDNYGFAAWVHANKEALIAALGPGRHFGEWYGSGVNSGYGLEKGIKRLALFDQRFADKLLPEGVIVVPVLYRGPYTSTCVDNVMAELKKGSVISPGFDKPEGVVIRFERNGAMFKNVFEAEESAWKGVPKQPKVHTSIDQDKVNVLLQPVRLEKLLSRDERFVADYPKSLPLIAKAYSDDLEKEAQFEGIDEDVAKAARKQFFVWIKQMMSEKGYVV